MEVGEEGDYYTYRYTVTTRMTSALRWAAMRAILMFHNCEGQSHKTVHKSQLLKRKESRSGIKSARSFRRRPLQYQPTVSPLGQTGSL